MGGQPNYIDVTQLEVVSPGGLTGSEMKDVIELGLGGDPFDVLVTFEVDQSHAEAGEWTMAEWVSDPARLVPFPLFAAVRAFAESIGPGPEVILNSPDVEIRLRTNGNPGGGPPGTSRYEVRIPVADPDAAFLDDGGNPAPGVYRIQSRADHDSGFFASAYFSGDVVIRVADRTP